jgi:ATP phosphoribosyltransferase
MSNLILAIPSKGRLMEQAQGLLEKSGFQIDRIGSDRGYRGKLLGIDGVEIAFLSASDIAAALKSREVDLGITGEDLLREAIAPDDKTAEVLLRLNFGPAKVVVAVPDCWLDVAQMADLEDVAQQFYRAHGRRMRVATKYLNLTRRFFAQHGVAGYRIVESLGATEGAPASGSAELIVDITTSGSTLKANALKVLDDGLILDSCAVLAGTAHAMVAERTLAISKALRIQLISADSSPT